MGERKVGLALGGGAARGLAHIGVLEVMENEGIAVDMIAGTSAGAAIGALYAQGKSASLIKNLFQDLNRKQLASMVDLALPKTGLIGGRKIKDWLKRIIGGDLEFSDLGIPFACVATDILTGEEITLDQGSLLEGVRASISIPGIFTVVKLGGRYLVDGGLVNPVPVSILKRMGADFTIAVNVMPDISDRDKTRWDGGKAYSDKEPNIFSILMQSIYIGSHSRAKASLKDADIIIQPKVAHIGPTDFWRAREFIEQGRIAAQRSITEVRRKLEG